MRSNYYHPKEIIEHTFRNTASENFFLRKIPVKSSERNFPDILLEVSGIYGWNMWPFRKEPLSQFIGALQGCIFVNLLFEKTFKIPSGPDGKECSCHAGNWSLIPGLGRSLGEGNGNPLQYSCLENSMDGGAWWATVHGVAKSQT